MANAPQIDALLPGDMAAKAESIGVNKATLDPVSMFALAVLAGAFIGLGAIFATTVAAGTFAVSTPDASALPAQMVMGWPTGWQRLLSGVVFSLGLILVVVGGAELFTGNNLIIMAWASGKVSTRLLGINWLIVYAGNFVGALGTAALMLWSRQHEFGGGQIGLQALTIAQHKMGLDFGQAVALGILCNGLVCLAVWLTYGARSVTDKVMAIVPPITAFVAAGFEHSVANMYFIPIAMLIRAYAPPSFWATIHRTPDDFASLTLSNFLLANLLPVTLGNIIGGTVLVGGFYWFIYLRRR
jgi:formate/nitrite transporter